MFTKPRGQRSCHR